MKDVWQSVPGTRFFSRNGEGLYERLTDQLYLRVDEVDETDAREVCTRFAEAFEARTNSQSALLNMLLPPLVFMIIVTFIGFTIVALMMPLLSLICNLSGGY